MAVLAGETVLHAGGQRSSDILLSFTKIHSSIRQVEIHIWFDPAVVQVADADQNALNGTQIAVAAFLRDTHVQTNQTNNGTGQIMLVVTGSGLLPTSEAGEWLRAATITWLARSAGRSAVEIADQTWFTLADGARVAAHITYDGSVLVRAPGKIGGSVYLQGRTTHGDISVSGILVASRINQTFSALDGRFLLTTSHGEGFYTLTAYAPGYLTAESDNPIRVTMDSVVDASRVTLLGGDANGDNRIDVRDLSFVAWHFNNYDSAADINGDGVVDISDLALTTSNFGLVGPVTWTVPARED